MITKGGRMTHAIILYVSAVICFVASLLHPWGKLGSGLFVGVGICLLLLAAIRLRRAVAPREESQDLDALMAYINARRHTWINHIQVMTGYVSLQRYDRLQSYLKRIMSETEQENRICRLGYTPLSHYLLTRDVKRHPALNIHIAKGSKVHNVRQGRRLLKAVQQIENTLLETRPAGRHHSSEPRITLASLGDDIVLYVDLPGGGLSCQTVFTSLSARLSAFNGKVAVEWEEAASECAVRIRS